MKSFLDRLSLHIKTAYSSQTPTSVMALIDTANLFSTTWFIKPNNFLHSALLCQGKSLFLVPITMRL